MTDDWSLMTDDDDADDDDDDDDAGVDEHVDETKVSYLPRFMFTL